MVTRNIYFPETRRPLRKALRVPEVAERIGAGQSVTRKLIARGVIPSFRIGRVIRVDADLLEQWIAENSGSGRRGPQAI